MADDAAELLRRAGQEAGHVFEGQDRDVEGVAEAHEARALHRGIDVQAARQKRRLIGHDARSARPSMRAKPTTMFLRPVLVHFEELAIVHHAVDHVLDVVGQVGFGRDDRVERRVHAVDGVGGGAPRRIFAVVLRQVAEQLADHAQAFGIVGGDEVAHAADRVVGDGAAQLFLGDVFVGDGLDARPGR